MNILIIGERENQSLVKCQEYFSSFTNLNSIFISPADIINDLLINDSISNDGVVDINWELNNMPISPSNTKLIINRLEFLPLHLFDEFIEEDRSYAQSEYSAYLMFALRQFPCVINKPTQGSISGFCKSLPYQWDIANGMEEGIFIPRWFFGLEDEKPDNFSHHYILAQNIYDGKHWVTHQSVTKMNFESTMPELMYKRPSGTPVLVHLLNEHAFFTELSSKKKIPEILKIKEHALKMMRHFELSCAELLYFHEKRNNVITFGSIQPYFEFDLMPEVQQEEYLCQLSRIL